MERILAEQGNCMSVKSLQAAFRDHTDLPLSICRHNAPVNSWATTPAAFVAELAALEIYIAIDNPCTAPFVCYTVPREQC